MTENSRDNSSTDSTDTHATGSDASGSEETALRDRASDERPVEAHQTPSGHLLLAEENTTDGRWMEAKRPVEVAQ